MPAFSNRKCPFKTSDQPLVIDYKNVRLLRPFITRYGKIKPKYYSGVSLKYQKPLARAIKNARYMGLLPYTR